MQCISILLRLRLARILPWTLPVSHDLIFSSGERQQPRSEFVSQSGIIIPAQREPISHSDCLNGCQLSHILYIIHHGGESFKK